MSNRNLEEMQKQMDKIGLLKSITRAGDSTTFGLQLQLCYLDKWKDIKKIVKKDYQIDMNRIGPIVTSLVHKQVLLAREITEEIKQDERVRDYANRCAFPTKSVLYPSDDPERIIDSIIFLLVFRSLMGVSHEYTKPEFKSFISNGVSDKILEKMFSLRGHTTKETEPFFDTIVKQMTEKMKKRKNQK